jgi:hypothetical protein
MLATATMIAGREARIGFLEELGKGLRVSMLSNAQVVVAQG